MILTPVIPAWERSPKPENWGITEVEEPSEPIESPSTAKATKGPHPQGLNPCRNGDSTLPWAPEPRPESPFHEEIPPAVLPDRPLAQPEAVPFWASLFPWEGTSRVPPGELRVTNLSVQGCGVE